MRSLGGQEGERIPSGQAWISHRALGRGVNPGEPLLPRPASRSEYSSHLPDGVRNPPFA